VKLEVTGTICTGARSSNSVNHKTLTRSQDHDGEQNDGSSTARLIGSGNGCVRRTRSQGTSTARELPKSISARSNRPLHSFQIGRAELTSAWRHARRLTLDVGTLPVDCRPAPICNRALRTCKLQDDSCSFALPHWTLCTHCAPHPARCMHRVPHTSHCSCSAADSQNHPQHTLRAASNRSPPSRHSPLCMSCTQATLESRGTLEAWKTAVLYQLVHAVAILALPERGNETTINLWTAGSVMFSGSIYGACARVSPLIVGDVSSLPFPSLFLRNCLHLVLSVCYAQHERQPL
jgi:hypothetical protein